MVAASRKTEWQHKEWSDPNGPPNLKRPSPQFAIKGEQDPQWFKDFQRDGFAVIKEAISREKASQYADRGEQWLEGFKLGYKRDDPSTWDVQSLPNHVRGGMYGAYSIAHSQMVWDARVEPGVTKIFETLWGTDKLTVSFSGACLAVPLPSEQVEENARPWPHSDQSAHRPWPHCVQGILNLLPCGEEDGGLLVLRGSAKLFGQWFKDHKHLEPPEGWPTRDGMKWRDEHGNAEVLNWFLERGCEWVKPAMDPGDFVIWDSRTVHYGRAPTGERKRFAIYICYKPDEFLTPDFRKLKVQALEHGWATNHEPTDFNVSDSHTAPWHIDFPYGKPVLSDRMLQLAGARAYQTRFDV